jgi:hypothetical protein
LSADDADVRREKTGRKPERTEVTERKKNKGISLLCYLCFLL